MKLIQENPYRIAGILANASPSEFDRQKARILRYAPIGRQVDSDLDFPFLDTVDRTDVDKVTKAFSGIEQRDEKVNHSIFWFIKVNPFDQTAIDYLKKGDIEKAIDIWGKKTEGKEVNSKNFSCFNNIGTLKLLSDSKGDIKEGLEAKIKLIESPNFADFVHTVADQTYTIDNQKQTEKFVDDILKQFKGRYSSSDTLKLFNNCNGTTQKYLSQKFTEEPLHKIETQIESCKKKHNADKDQAYDLGLRLYKNTKDDLSLLKSLVGPSDLKYKMIADNLAKELLQCGIDYFKENYKSSSSNSVRESSLKLMEYALNIAVSKLIKDRAKDHIATLEEMKDQEINQAIAILSSIKLAYEKEISEIDAQVANMRRTMSYNQTINYSKVDKMKEDCLNWNKVVEVVGGGISINDVEIIQRCSNQSKVSEYKNLVDFLIGKLGPIQINQVKHICYWKDVRAAQAKSTAKQVGKTISTATDGCYIATMAYGDYEHPQVLKLRIFRDEFLRQSYLGRRFIKLYYKYSPLLVEKLKDKPKTNEIIRTLLDQLIKIIRKK
jgi:hypothetical protein